MGLSNFIGEITILPYTFAPRGYTWCEGQNISVAQYQTLFALIGTYYGGNGTSNFGVPNLKGRAPLHYGQAPGLQDWRIGEWQGYTDVVLTNETIPSHDHNLTAVVKLPPIDTVDDPDMTLNMAKDSIGGTGFTFMYNSQGCEPNTEFATEAVEFTGGTDSHENRQPYLALNFCIAFDGLFPPRS